MMNAKVLDAMMGKLAPIVHQSIVNAVQPLEARIAALEQSAVQPIQLAAAADAAIGPLKDAVANIALRVGEIEEREIMPGPPGPEGPAGKDGRDGVDGKDGAPGADGSPGRDGSDGKPGEPGKNGVDGKDGAPGRDGKDGADGAAGRDGKDGEKGDPGIDGTSVAPEVVVQIVSEAVEASLSAVLTKFMINEDGVLVGVSKSGDITTIGRVRGEDGARGASVMDGQIDDDGALTLRMSDGRHINVGHVRGKDGAVGNPGEPGRPGRDAHEIQILPGVDESRSYVEGVCARHRGGLIRADRQTDPIEGGDVIKAGWSVLLEGIAEESERVMDDGRYTERVTTYTSGKSFTRRIKNVTMIYRGVWEDRAFDQGDATTFGGSIFIATRDTNARPETNKDWRLAVKRGRDGANGKNGERGPVGPKGERGERGATSY